MILIPYYLKSVVSFWKIDENVNITASAYDKEKL